MTERPEHTETVGEVLHPFGGGTPPLPPGTLVAGRFETVRVLGSGGSSIVYEAQDRTLGTRVALKILRADRATPAALKRLHREAKIAREAQDSRLVRVWDIGEAAEGAFISMELVEGESLRDVIARGPLKIAEAVRIGTEVLAALERLHALGIVHRDLKPSNVLLTRHGGVKLVDFGLARHWASDESRATQADALVGTVEYLSPEQALGKPLDARTDLYSFGILLFEMLTASVPFRSESTLGAVLAHVNEHAPDVRTVRPEVPSWLARVVGRLMEKRPGDRYAAAADVLADLQRERARVRIPRRRWLAAAVVLATGLTIAGAWQMSRPKFASVARTGTGIAALDESGRALWTYGTVRTFAAVARREGRTAVVAVVDRPAGEPRPSVFLLDPEDGTRRGTIAVPAAPHLFPGYSDDFFPSGIDPVDLDRDGSDELVATFAHRYWPSYAVLIDPFEASARIVFVGSGNHGFIGAADLDGGGRDDLVFYGINNRMGWYGSLIAVRTSEARAGSEDISVAAATPDNDAANVAMQAVVWCELFPQGFWVARGPRIDRDAGGVIVPLVDGRTIRADLDGFIAGTRSSLSRDARLAARRRAFDLARASRRSAELGAFDRALAEIDEGRALAASAGSPYLVEWLDRSRAAILVKNGSLEEASAAFELVARSSESPGDVCWDAGKAFHLAGDRARARLWYERGLESSGSLGRFKRDLIEAGMLAYAEDRQFDAARAFVDRAIRAHPSNEDSRVLAEAFLQWQEGRRPSVPPSTGVGRPDFERALELEIRNSSGAPPAELLATWSAMSAFSELRPLADSLRADLLRRLGRHAEAAELARRALEEATIRGKEDPVLAYFIPLIRQRYEAAAAATQP